MNETSGAAALAGSVDSVNFGRVILGCELIDIARLPYSVRVSQLNAATITPHKAREERTS